MAGKFGSASIIFLVDGYNFLASKPGGLTVKETAEQEETTGLGDSAREWTPVGMASIEITQDGGFWDTTTGYSHDALSGSVPSSPQDSVRVACFGFAGQTIGEPMIGTEGVFNNEFEVLAQSGVLTKANATFTASGQLDRGVILQELAAKTADWDTESSGVDRAGETDQNPVPITSSSVANPTVITTTVPHGLTTGDKVLIAGHSGSTPDINGEEAVTVLTTTTFTVVQNVTVGGTGGTLVRADSSNGGVGYMQVTAASGFTNFVGTIEDSADDITYGSLVAFADNVSAPFAERVTVAGQVERYLAFDGNVTGSGSITVFVGFARNE